MFSIICITMLWINWFDAVKFNPIGAIGYISDGDDVQFPSRISAEKSADYVAYNNVPMGATHYKGKIFLTVPRRRVGVPSTLNFVYTKSTKGSSPSFKAFPSEDINRLHVNTQPTFEYLYPIRTYRFISNHISAKSPTRSESYNLRLSNSFRWM